MTLLSYRKPTLLALGALIAGCAFTAAPAQAQNATITFEGTTNTIYNAPIVRSGYLIGNPVGQEQHFHEITSTAFGLPNNGTGVLLEDRDTQIFFTADPAAGFTTFTLGSVDVAAALSNGPADGITIFGFLGGTQTGAITLAALGNGYTTLSGASLGTVDTLLFDGIGGGGGFVLDNVQLAAATAAVPEPSQYAMGGMLGASLLFGMVRAKRRTSGKKAPATA